MMNEPDLNVLVSAHVVKENSSTKHDTKAHFVKKERCLFITIQVKAQICNKISQLFVELVELFCFLFAIKFFFVE